MVRDGLRWDTGGFRSCGDLLATTLARCGLHLLAHRRRAYLIGTLLVRVLCNLPKNDALAAVPPSAPGAAGLWSSYLSSWTAWNHVRTAAALAAAALLTIALIAA
jgi:uncharacterized membrane protein